MLSLSLVAGSVAPALAGPTDLSGSWTLVQQRSDDVRDRIVASLGPGWATAEVRGDAPRLWIREWLLDQAERPQARVLTIELDPAEFRVAIGDELRVYHFGREASRGGPGGALLKATVRRDGERVVVEEKAVKGSGRVVETYELQPDGRSLSATWRVSHKGMREPLELKLGFRRTEP